MSKNSDQEAWVPRCFGRDYLDADLYPEYCKPCPFKEDCQFFTEERKFKAVD